MDARLHFVNFEFRQQTERLPIEEWPCREPHRLSRSGFRDSKLGCRLVPIGKFLWVPAKVAFFLFFLPLGLLLLYGQMFFHIRTFESPIDGLSFVKDTAAPQRNAFRKKTVEAVCDPILQQIERVKKIRKKTHKGTVKYPEMQQDLSEVRNRLKEIMTEARLRRIPIEFKHKYHKNLYALQSCYRATHALEDSFAQETPAARERLYKESIKLTHKARRQCLESRDYFAGDGWRTATPKQDKKPLPSDDERGFPKSRSTR